MSVCHPVKKTFSLVFCIVLSGSSCHRPVDLAKQDASCRVQPDRVSVRLYNATGMVIDAAGMSDGQLLVSYHRIEEGRYSCYHSWESLGAAPVVIFEAGGQRYEVSYDIPSGETLNPGRYICSLRLAEVGKNVVALKVTREN